MAHTPTPWKSKQRDTIIEIVGADGVEVAKTSWHGSIRDPYPLKPEAQENIAFIVRAVNSHEALVEALREMESFVTIMFSRQPDGSVSDTVPTPIGPHVKLGDIMRNVRAALSTAESGK